MRTLLALAILLGLAAAAHAQGAPSSRVKYATDKYTCADYLADLPILGQYVKAKASGRPTTQQMAVSFVLRGAFSDYVLMRTLGEPNAVEAMRDPQTAAVLANELTAVCKKNRKLNFAEITGRATSQQEAHDRIMQLRAKLVGIQPVDVNSTLLGMLDAQDSRSINLPQGNTQQESPQ